MNGEAIKKADTATLWSLLTDVSEVMEQRGYKPGKGNAAFLFWYEIFKQIESEIDRRMLIDYEEG